MTRRALAPLVVLVSLLGVPATATAVQPVQRVEVERYLGTWKQLAAIPQWFDAACLRNTTATYSLNPNGTVRVANRCDGPFGLQIPITGAARVADRTTNAQLEVSFLRFGGRVIYSGVNYVIIGLAPDYSWAVVADPGRTSAFVLSRTATQPNAVLDGIRSILTENGINSCRLRVTKQAGGATSSPAFC